MDPGQNPSAEQGQGEPLPVHGRTGAHPTPTTTTTPSWGPRAGPGADVGAGAGPGGGEAVDADVAPTGPTGPTGPAGEARAAYLDGLSPNQEAALLALLTEPTVLKAAERSGVGARTIYKWLERDPRFAAAYRSARREAFVHAMTITQRYAPMAIQALARIMVDPAAPASARVSAATAVLNFARQSIEIDDLAERVRALEAARSDSPALAA